MDTSHLDESGMDELQAIGDEISDAQESPWQPDVVAGAFLPSSRERVGLIELYPLTMEGWIALDQARSPFLHGELSKDPVESVKQLHVVVRVLSRNPQLTLEELIDAVKPADAFEARATIRRIMNGAMATSIKMRPRGTKLRQRRGGFGGWLLVFSQLVALGISREEALKFPVAQALAVTAADLFLTGWEVAETDNPTYAERNV